MESNISRDHIALEAMKTLIETSVTTKQRIWDRIKFYFGKGKLNTTSCVPDDKNIAKLAYQYADAMIAEREKTKDE